MDPIGLLTVMPSTLSATDSVGLEPWSISTQNPPVESYKKEDVIKAEAPLSRIRRHHLCYSGWPFHPWVDGLRE